MPKKTFFETYECALVVVRHPATGKWLAVHETKGRGVWLPAGGVEKGESLQVRRSAVRWRGCAHLQAARSFEW
jgi:hypothetical protein